MIWLDGVKIENISDTFYRKISSGQVLEAFRRMCGLVVEDRRAVELVDAKVTFLDMKKRRDMG